MEEIAEKSPLISVIIPAFNCASSVGAALRSILDQTYKNLEVIVVDDHSTDGTLEAAKKEARGDSRVRYIIGPDDPERFDQKLNRNINAGWSARNAGLEVARGELITFQDADDVSLLNRLEVQRALLERYGAIHVCTDVAPLTEERIGTLATVPDHPKMVGPEEIYRASQRSKGIIPKILPALAAAIPFRWKRIRIINKLFFRTLESYPGCAGIPLFRREVIDRVRFRPLKNRIWPSFMGRGADRDFDFQVAETFRNSYVFFIPLYLWSRLPRPKTS